MTTQQVSFQEVLRWTDEQCREFLEAMRWPDGPRCPKCGATEPYRMTRKSQTKNTVQKLYKCRACHKQFTATVGTIFEDSHIPLSRWFAAIYLMCASKKGMSAHQLHRELDITYKSAWFMCHRIREAMRDKGELPLLTGTIEADETYIHPRTRRGHKVWHERVQDEIEMGLRPAPDKKAPYQDNPTVFGILERGGKARTVKVPAATGPVLRPIMGKMIDMKNARLMTDGHPAYRQIKHYLPHEVIDHEVEYVRGDVHIQGIENYWSLLKRGVYGVFHHLSEGYLPSYLNEFEFRFNRRKIQDAERFAALVRQTQGRVLWYCQTAQPENPYA
ncbi:MAG: IS1595 family transposase [Chloroflexi bacterium]|nr:IS1595 family transposase [Chloroflexota bacterium]